MYVYNSQKGDHNELVGVTTEQSGQLLYLPCIASKKEVQSVKNILHSGKKDYRGLDLSQAIKSVETDEIRISTNELVPWSIKDGTTTAVLIKKPTNKNNICLLQSHRISLTKEGDITISGYLACHRGFGKLIITGLQNGSDDELTIDFNTDYQGGTDRKKFNYFSRSFTPQSKELTIRLHIAHENTLDEKTENCFYFIGDLSFSINNYEEQSSIPRIIGELPETNDIRLYKIHLQKFKGQEDSPLILQWADGKAEEAFAPINLSATFIENFHHTFKVSASDPNACLCIYIDNILAKRFKMKGDEDFVTLPSDFFTGIPAIASLTDASGSQVLDQIAINPPRTLVSEDTVLEEGKKVFPTEYSLRNSYRLESIKQNLINSTEIDPISIKNAIRNLELNYKTLKLEPIDFPKITGNIKASIIIPAHNKVETTYYCLCSLLLSRNQNNFEVIVVDDGSTDETQELEDIVKGISVIHNTEPLRFIGACNKGASVAKGEFVVLLNNDTEVTSGWLDALIQGFNHFDQVGLVGSRLLYPDGRLQDAGGIIWKTGDPWNYGNGQNPCDPKFSYARQVDYLSGAALMTTKKIWDEVGGLSNYLKPMYFEDTDLSFKIRDAGYKTYFIPDSTIFHFEGITSGTDTSKGFKRYQEINRPNFKKRWSHAFSSHSPVGTKPDLEKDRNIVGRILFIDYQLPRGDRAAGSYAAIKEINLLQSLGFKATFLPVNLGDLGQYKTKLQNDGVEVITAPFYLSPEHFLEDRGSEFDIVYVTRYNVLQACINSIKHNCGDAKIILCNADLHFLRELRAAARTQNPELLVKVKKTQQEEVKMMKKADVVVSYNEIEHSVIFSHSEGTVQPLKCPWVVELPKRVIDPTIHRKGLSFLGSFEHPPNKEGIQWFIQTVFPYIDRDINLNVYGSGMTEDDIEDLSADKVDVHGFVEHLHDAFDQHKIFVAPLLSGAGIKGKVLSAVAHGIPTILSPVASEGTGLRHGQECLIAESTDEWKEAIHRLLDDESLWLKISSGALAYIEEKFSFESGRKDMRKILESINNYSSLP